MARKHVVLIAGSIFGLALILWSIAPLRGYEADTFHYKLWLILVTREGVGAAYSGEYPESYAIYPPVFLYFLKAIGTGYQILVDRSLDAERVFASNGLSIAIKSPGIVFHLMLALALIVTHYRELGFRKAYFTGLLYGLNPAAIFAVAYWGQPDSIHTFLLALGVAALLARQPIIGWLLIGAGAFTKPQTWPLLPLAALLTWRVSNRQGLIQGATGLAAVSLVLSAPFWTAGTLGDLLGLPINMTRTAAVVSASTTNLWWLIGPREAPDRFIWLGGLSFATWGYLFAGALGLVAVALLIRAPTRDAPEILALMAFGFTMLATKAHENHTFQVLGLLSLGGLVQPRSQLVYALVSLTLLINMVLFTPDILAWLQNRVLDSILNGAKSTNAMLGVGLLGTWLLMLVGKRWSPVIGVARNAPPAG